ncbi:MAG: hypothetical protein A2Z34_00820 [Planctomycetes bacterium RBG_16_59_8]|nr:MAG: hypothetical protein A2Z34_00820 [Planctomycetes bacterium RBG_16_59_8]
MNTTRLFLGLALLFLISPAAFAQDDQPPRAASANGRYKIELKVASRQGGTSVGYSVTEKNDKGEFREIATGADDDLGFSDRFKAGILCQPFISDEGRFALVGIVTTENEKVLALYSKEGKRVALLELSQILTEKEIPELSAVSKHFPYLAWHKKESLKIEGEDLVFETRGGRKVTIHLADGKIAKEEKENEQWIEAGQCKGDCPEGGYAAVMSACKRCARQMNHAAKMCDGCADEMGLCRKCYKKLVK